MAERSDEDLVRLAKAGQTAAFGDLVKRHMRGVYALAGSFVQSRSDADDLSQETFLRAYQGLGSFRGRSSFRTWLYRIALNVCSSHLKRRPPETHSLEDPALLADMPSAGRTRAPTPPEAASLSELQETAMR